VWRAAQNEERFLITQDLDFSDARRYAPGAHHGLLLVRLRDPGRKALLHHIRGLFENERVEDWAGCLVVATDRKLRIRRPPDE
jgi:predicted nuclease of predicted toxin-antitoxin system